MTLYREAKLNPILHNLSKAASGEDKRSDHPDFATSSELKKKEWSGVRKNSLTDSYEFWIVGEIVREVPGVMVALDFMALERAHIDVFGLPSAPELLAKFH